MKLVIFTLPMRPLKELAIHHYPVDGNKTIEYDGEVRYPINAVLAKTLEKDEEVTILFIATTGENSFYKEQETAFRAELDVINASIGAKLSFDIIEIPFLPTKKTFNKLLTDLTDKIPRPPLEGKGAQVFADMTYGMKPTVLPLFCALAFAENFCNAVIEYHLREGRIQQGNTENPRPHDIRRNIPLLSL